MSKNKHEKIIDIFISLGLGDSPEVIQGFRASPSIHLPFMIGFLMSQAIRTNDKGLEELMIKAFNLLSNDEKEKAFAQSFHLEKPLIATMKHNESLRRRDVARKGAKAKHANSPKAKIKLEVKLHWDKWQEKPNLYAGKAGFARVMMDKYSDIDKPKETPQSPSKIEAWCREWEKEKTNSA
jgi:hypothetical protein